MNVDDEIEQDIKIFREEQKKEKKLGRFHELGVLKLKQTRHLIPGNVADIGLMDKFIHQNHHQADLTVTLCFRTPQVNSKSLSNYLSSGLRFEKNHDLMSLSF